MKNDILIAYYSWHGNTRKIAELIQREIGGTLFEIEPVQPYTTDYAWVKRGRSQHLNIERIRFKCWERPLSCPTGGMVQTFGSIRLFRSTVL
jgi:hypothetical protein